MPSRREEDLSDSDDESLSEVETSVLLGVPDGSVDVLDDLKDAAVSRIGGHPAFLLSKEPPISSSQCKNCSYPMELLAQLFCPFEESPMDRVLYIWGCSRGECQRKDGTIRAWRALKLNEKYAAKLEKKKKTKLKEREAREEAERAEKGASHKKNPFSMGQENNAKTFGHGLGAQLFGDKCLPESEKQGTSEFEPTDTDKENEETENDLISDSEENSVLITALAATSLADSPWSASPAYPQSQYLSTVPEYLPPTQKGALPKGVQVTEHIEGGDKNDSISWAFEGYENSLDVDQVFERFMKRTQYEGSQCLRYDLSGTPLPYSRDDVFLSIFPMPEASLTTITRAEFNVQSVPKRTYSPRGLPPCPHCGSERVFECQLMPNLINILKPSESLEEKKKTQTEAERRKEVERLLKGIKSKETRGMEWGTCMVFSCARDCCLDEECGEAKLTECWKEEHVIIQWEN